MLFFQVLQWIKGERRTAIPVKDLMARSTLPPKSGCTYCCFSTIIALMPTYVLPVAPQITVWISQLLSCLTTDWLNTHQEHVTALGWNELWSRKVLRSDGRRKGIQLPAIQKAAEIKWAHTSDRLQTSTYVTVSETWKISHNKVGEHQCRILPSCFAWRLHLRALFCCTCR